MAKLRSGFTLDIPILDMDQLYKPIVFVVDMVNGFMKEGNLCDASIMDITNDIKELVSQVKPSVFICDTHDLDAREFDSSSIHCIENTSESKVISELQPFVKRSISKNSSNAFHSPEFQDMLPELLERYRDVVIVGCWSEVDVMQFALTLNAYFNQGNMDAHRVIVPYNMIETFHIEKEHD